MSDDGRPQDDCGLRAEGEAARRVLGHDWSRTALGPIEGWPPALKTLVEVILGSNRPMFVAWGPERTLIYNEAYAGVLANKHPALGQDLLAVWSEIRADLQPLVERAYRGEATSMPEIPLVMERKGYREPTWWDYAYTPIRDAAGRVGGFLCACHEVTEQVVMLRDRAFRLALEDRMRALGDPDEMMVAAVEMLRRHLGASRIAYAEDAGDEEHVTVTMDSNDQVPSIKGTYRLGDYGEHMLAEMRAGRAIVRDSIAADPSLTEAEKAAHAGLDIGATANIPVVRAGRLVALIAVHYTTAHHYPQAEVELAREVAARVWSAVERTRAERHRELLIAELNHRVKNTLAIVQSIAAQTLRSAPDPDRFTTLFTDRVVALSRAHNLLAETYWAAPRLSEIVETALAPFNADDRRIAWDGPEARVDPSPAVALSLVLHELATNAAKYGALSAAGGRVTLQWRAITDRLVELSWREGGGPPVTPPASRGFGSRLITAAGQQLGGPVDLRFDPAGVTCRLSLGVRSGPRPTEAA